MASNEGLYGNPHTMSHLAGIEAGRVVDVARRQVARAIAGDARRVVFTSGATEANNLALFGLARAAKHRRRIVTVETEHSSVIEPAVSLRSEGFDVELLPVGCDGIVDLETVERAVDERTILVSVMHVNNETGVIQPIREIAEICRNAGALLHSDCAQSLGRLHINVNELGANLLTLSAHKCYGPKGIGALYISGRPKPKIKPLCLGGGQEGGLRPGTLPVPLCVGFGEACRLAAEDVDQDGERMGRLATNLLEAIRNTCPNVRLNGSTRHRVTSAFNLSFPGATGEELLEAFGGIQVSSGSACTSAVVEPSKVLTAYGLSTAEADASLRFCVGRFTTEDDIEVAKSVVQGGLRALGITR